MVGDQDYDLDLSVCFLGEKKGIQTNERVKGGKQTDARKRGTDRNGWPVGRVLCLTERKVGQAEQGSKAMIMAPRWSVLSWQEKRRMQRFLNNRKSFPIANVHLPFLDQIPLSFDRME